MSETKFSPPPESEYPPSAETKTSKPSDAPSLFSRFKTGVKEAPRNVADLAGRGAEAVRVVAHKTTEVAGNTVNSVQGKLADFKDSATELSKEGLEKLRAELTAERKDAMVTAVLDALRSNTGQEIIKAIPYAKTVLLTLEGLVGKDLQGNTLGIFRRGGKLIHASGSAVKETFTLRGKMETLKTGKNLGLQGLASGLNIIGDKLQEKGDIKGAAACKTFALYLETKIKLS
jgi:hypothetical protein